MKVDEINYLRDLSEEEILTCEFLAKSNGQFLEQHTNHVIQNFVEFLRRYPNKLNDIEKDLIFLACKYHDYGKVNTQFQEYMKTKKKPLKWLQHGFFSACFINKKYFLEKYGKAEGKEYYSALVTAIFYHHTRECSYLIPLCNDFEEDFETYVKENGQRFIKNDLRNYLNLNNLLFEYPNYGTVALPSLETWILYSKIKGILNRCDYAASANESTIEEEILENGKSIADLVLEQYSTLRKSQQFALEHQKNNIVLIAPTGSGKTEAALLWIGREKGFYTLPLKVASTAIYHRIKDEEGYNYSKASLLHSDALDLLIDENGEKQIDTISAIYEDYQRMKRLSYPLTICTVDQIFKFPFKSLGQEQFLATLSYSKVVIDEIQMYSSRILACLLVGLSMLIKAGGKFMIITATFPDLFAHFLKKVVGEENYLIENCATEDSLLRHRILFEKGNLNYEKMIESAKNKKVLVICNSISTAIATYKKLKELNCNLIKGLLHSHFIKKDRNLLEKKILKFQENGIWVTSPIVEASLDIDFDELHTEMCSADSLLQRFGRCYRKRVYEKENPNIYIYETGNAYIYDGEIYERSIEKLIPYQGKLLSESDKICYLNEVYKLSEIKDTKYYKEISRDIKMMTDIYPMKYEDREVQNLFREISNVSIIPDNVFIENDLKIQECINVINQDENFEKKLLAKKELLKYTLSVRYHYGNKQEFEKIPGTDLYRLNGYYNSELGFIEGEDRFESRMY